MPEYVAEPDKNSAPRGAASHLMTFDRTHITLPITRYLTLSAPRALSFILHSDGNLQTNKFSSAAKMGPSVRDQDLCQYLGQLCLNKRARNRRGSLLLLCEEHRALANRNQRRYRLRQELLRLKQEMHDQAPRLPSVPRAPCVLSPTASIVKDKVDQAMELWFIETFGQGRVEGFATPGSWLPLHELDCSSEDTIQELLDTYFTDEDDQQ